MLDWEKINNGGRLRWWYCVDESDDRNGKVKTRNDEKERRERSN